MPKLCQRRKEARYSLDCGSGIVLGAGRKRTQPPQVVRPSHNKCGAGILHELHLQLFCGGDDV